MDRKLVHRHFYFEGPRRMLLCTPWLDYTVFRHSSLLSDPFDPAGRRRRGTQNSELNDVSLTLNYFKLKRKHKKLALF